MHTIPLPFKVPPDYFHCYVLYGSSGLRIVMAIEGTPEIKIGQAGKGSPVENSMALDWIACVMGQIRKELE